MNGKPLTFWILPLLLIATACSAQSSEEGATNVKPVKTAIASQKAPKPILQVGPWYPAPSNIEEPYINIIHASEMRWSGGDMHTADLLENGYIDLVTGLPSSLPNKNTLTSDVYFTANDKTFYDGNWVLEWEVADNERADLSMLYVADHLQKKTDRNRVEFKRDAASGATPYHAAIQIKRLDAPLTALRLYRAENETALHEGKIYNPVFIEAVSEYDIIRMMDLQEANRALVRGISDVASNDAAYWGNKSWESFVGADRAPLRPPYQSMPFDAVFSLGVEADSALWVHAPITLGSDLDIFSSDIFDQDVGKWLNNISAQVRLNATATLENQAWDVYADRFVQALILSDYPEDRPLYVTLANEVWNFAGQYNLTTRYALALGQGLAPEIGGGDARTGYGAASARWKLALDAALERADRNQRLIYVVESQAANPSTTHEALRAAKTYLMTQGEDWAAHSASFGVSVASYWGSVDFFKSSIDPNDTGAIATWVLEGPPNHIATLPWVLRMWKAHAALAENFGVPFIGAYEGGSHFEKPAEMRREIYKSFIWGEEDGLSGGDVNLAVNQALAEAFPGVILSNYVLAGPTGGQPWFEGPIGVENPYEKSWGRLRE
ncbi:hypothetical protein PUV54_13900 [Hyphococcus flavus]|uniref:Uncharacterized protein n=1 Tax=Hyphococcus flavus TaxID=1866326 RepID=A0AAF0CBI6_9PROT|nr:hypothetical protein [Hyphococcus flavus]WDI31045.1 hypothetical protein PUV54_13900 [Hyphococcus flavus]